MPTKIDRDGNLDRVQAAVQVELRDAQGVPCLDARNRVSFHLAGDGTTIDDYGTSTGARVVQTDNGRALISVRQEGRSVVSVTSAGLPTQFTHLQGE